MTVTVRVDRRGGLTQPTAGDVQICPRCRVAARWEADGMSCWR